jgi:DNA-binding NarL/FixJ family response regulator
VTLSSSTVPSKTEAAVFLAEFSPFDCQLLCDSLARNDLRVIGWAATAGDVVAGVVQHKPNVAVISSRLQDGAMAGFYASSQIRKLQLPTRVVILLDTSEPACVIEAFRAGAVGVFARTHLSSELCKCIRCVLAGEIWAGNQEIGYVIDEIRKTPAPHAVKSNGVSLLTRREGDVVGLVVNGLTNREIANELHLSEHTIKNYMFDIFEKLGISTRVELVLYALNRPTMPKSDTVPHSRTSVPRSLEVSPTSKLERDGCIL